MVKFIVGIIILTLALIPVGCAGEGSPGLGLGEKIGNGGGSPPILTEHAVGEPLIVPASALEPNYGQPELIGEIIVIFKEYEFSTGIEDAFTGRGTIQPRGRFLIIYYSVANDLNVEMQPATQIADGLYITDARGRRWERVDYTADYGGVSGSAAVAKGYRQPEEMVPPGFENMTAVVFDLPQKAMDGLALVWEDAGIKVGIQPPLTATPTFVSTPAPVPTPTVPPEPTSTPVPTPTANSNTITDGYSNPNGKWVIASSMNPLTDKPTITAHLAAISGESKWGDPIYLAIRCQNDETDLFINWSMFITTQSPKVTMRIDSGRVLTYPWNISTDYKATLYPDFLLTPITSYLIDLIELLLEADRFVAEVTPYGESPVTATWELVGIEYAVQPVRQACGW